MNRHAISLWTLLLANAALAALLGLGLAFSPQGVLGLFPAAVKPSPLALLQAIGFLLFGISLSLWTLVDVRRTDTLSRVAKIIAIALLFAWLAPLLVWRGETRPNSAVDLFMLLGTLLIGVGGFKIISMTAGGGSRALDPAGESAAQQERKRLARDLHDSIKQQLFSIKLSSAAAEERWESDPGGARAALADVRRSAHAAMVEMQAMLSQLRPEPLATAGLVEALREQCEALGYRSGIPVRFEIGDLPPDDRLPDSTRENLFRIAQEALSNVAHHARARTVEVRLEKTEQDGAPALLLQVRDDGQGFDPAGQSAGMGLRNMRERLEAVNGRLEVRSAPGEGTEVRACTPLTPPKAPGDPIRTMGKMMVDTPVVMVFLVLLASTPSLAFALFAIASALMVTSAVAKAVAKPGVGSAASLRLRLAGHQHRFLLLALAFWLTCAVVPTLEVPNPLYGWFAVPLYWLDKGVQVISPVLLLFALREAWSFFRLRRSMGGPWSEPGLPVWFFALMLLILLVSLPLLFLVPDPWDVARAGMLSYAILYMGWLLRAAS
ncbi:MAG TPA: histidine kinase [Thermoanaerobaculia bacterium]|nr:histidine kinase [Thermoanaerobaculia bacterium]